MAMAMHPTEPAIDMDMDMPDMDLPDMDPAMDGMDMDHMEFVTRSVLWGRWSHSAGAKRAKK